MNTDKLVPLDFSRNITPVAMKDLFWNSHDNVEVLVTALDQVNNFNCKSDSDKYFYVISYADRPNTGKQPVADDVVVNVIFPSGKPLSECGVAEEFVFGLDAGDDLIKAWKLDHCAMVERYQASLADKEDKRMNNIALNESDGSHYKVLSAIEALERFGYKYENGVWSQPEVKPELAAYMEPHVKPIYTQAMCDAGVCPMLGSKFISTDKTSDSRIADFYNLEVEVIGLNLTHDHKRVITFSHPTRGIGCGLFDECWIKPIKTDADKLRDALRGMNFNVDEVDDLLSNDKFTITLKGK